jgi:hypothetical protein
MKYIKMISCSHVLLSLFNYKISYVPYNIVHISILKFYPVILNLLNYL